jgi:hypothetical protein
MVSYIYNKNTFIFNIFLLYKLIKISYFMGVLMEIYIVLIKNNNHKKK